MNINKLLTASLLLISLSCKAGAFADELNKCVINSATADQTASIIHWVFVAQSKHPLNSKFYNPPKLTDEMAAVMAGEALADLYGASCKAEAERAVKIEGKEVLTSSPTFALRVSGGGFPLLGDSCSRSTGFLLHRAA